MKTKNYLTILGLPLLLSVMIANRCGSRESKPSDIEVPPSLSGLIDNAPTVGFCDLVDNPEKHNNQVVRTTAIFYRDRENSVLYSAQCNDTKKDAWADFDPSNDYSEESVKKNFNDALCISKPCPSGKATVIVVGRFEGPSQEGYGHLNGYRFRFVIMRIVSAAPPS